MVDFARIQNRIYYGYGKAAIRLGTAHDVYRSATGINPIIAPNFLFSQLIGMDQDFTYKKARKYNDPSWQFLAENGLLLNNYDYLVGPTITYFIVDVHPDDRLGPPVCVECNAVITITNPINTLTNGINPYQGYIGTDGIIVSQNCPVSILEQGRFERNNLALPTSSKLPNYDIYMPDFDDVVIKPGFIVVDDIGRRMNVISAERTKHVMGFRLVVNQLGV